MAAQLSVFSLVVKAKHEMQDNRGPAAPDPTLSTSATCHQTYPSPIPREAQEGSKDTESKAPSLETPTETKVRERKGEPTVGPHAASHLPTQDRLSEACRK